MTSNITKLSPIQFYVGRWFTHITPLFKKSPNVQSELKRLCELRVSRMEDVLQGDYEPDDLKEQIDLEDHIARVRCREFHWLVDVFTNAELCPLSFAIASELFPEKEWEILEGDDDEAIVTDRERAIVFDFVNCHSLSGVASLALCKEAEALNNLDAVKEVSRLNDERDANLDKSIQRLKKTVDRFSKGGEVLKFPNLLV